MADPYSQHADTIEAALKTACRCHGLSGDQAEEFCSWARLRLLDKDYRILRAFDGRSSLRTYLWTVVERLYLDWRNAELGKWRPSAAAARLGTIALELERLCYRDRLSFEDAVETLRSRGVATSYEECAALWAQLPKRVPARRVDEEALAGLAAPADSRDPVEQAEARRRAAKIAAALDSAVEALPPTDRLLVRLRYWSGISVARIASMNGIEPKVLHHRYERLWAQLRRSLTAQGLDANDLLDSQGLIGEDERE